MISDLMESGPGTLAGGDLDTDAGWRGALQVLLVNGIFYHGQNEPHTLARCYDLYLMDKPHLVNCGSYIDLPALVRKATGLEPEALWAVLFSFIGHTIAAASDPTVPRSIKRRSYFTQNFQLDQAASDRFFELVASDVGPLRAAVAEAYSLASIKPFHMLPLAQFPLVAVGDDVYCPSRQLMFDALTHGLYHRLLNALPPKDRPRFQTYIGEVFGDYVHRIFRRAYGGVSPLLASGYVGPQQLGQALSRTGRRAKVCDGLLLYGDAVVLIESKAKFFSLKARTGDSYDEYESKLSDIFVGAAGQLDATIAAIERGELCDLGADPDRIRAYYPLVVTLERIPMRRPLFGHVADEIRRAGLLGVPPAKVRPIQMVEAGELELIEVAVGDGASLRDLLERKCSDDALRGESFTNFCHEIGEKGLLQARNSYLVTSYRDLTKRVREWFRTRSRRHADQQDPGARPGGART